MKIYEYEMEYENGLLGHGNKRSLQFEENGSSFLFGTCETTLWELRVALGFPEDINTPGQVQQRAITVTMGLE